MESRTKIGLELLEKEEKAVGIHTLCKSVDTLLGGGIKPGTLTQVVGLPGVGKTTFCLQLCLNVQIPSFLNGVDGEAVYIGTNHSFSTFRLSQMTEAFVSRSNNIIKKMYTKRPFISVEEVLRGISVVQVCTIDELARVLISMEKYLKINERVKLVVLDGIDFPMFTERESYRGRVKVLYGLGQLMIRYISQYGLAIVVTNSMTTRFKLGNDGESNVEYYIPCLGETWSYVPNQILKLSTSPLEKSRKAELVKSAFCETGTANYRIIHNGFRD